MRSYQRRLVSMSLSVMAYLRNILCGWLFIVMPCQSIIPDVDIITVVESLFVTFSKILTGLVNGIHLQLSIKFTVSKIQRGFNNFPQYFILEVVDYFMLLLLNAICLHLLKNACRSAKMVSCTLFLVFLFEFNLRTQWCYLMELANSQMFLFKA